MSEAERIAVVAMTSVVLFALFMAVYSGITSAKWELFRDIANQRCAPQVALISRDDPYRYVCVPKETK